MKKITYLLFVFAFNLVICSCNKSTTEGTPLSSLEIVNTIEGSPGAMLNSNPAVVGYSAFGQFAILAGAKSGIYIYPIGDSSQPYYNGTLNAINGGIYSLYLTGTNPQSQLLLKDTITTYTDSSIGIRFINLSPDSGPLNIGIAGAAYGSTVASLAHASITSFQKFSANAANAAGYNFEIRNAADSLLTTYAQGTVVNKNITIVFTGSVRNGSFAPFTVNNF